MIIVIKTTVVCRAAQEAGVQHSWQEEIKRNFRTSVAL